jgi:hypothetical protein
VGEILIAGPGRGGGWSPTYLPSAECDLGGIGENPIIAYRMWQVRWAQHYPDKTLVPDLRGIHSLCAAWWREREVTAHCLSKPIAGRAGRPELFIDHDTPAPERRCTCGVSAFYEPFEDTGVNGVVALGGRAILHDIWLRAERARVECFALGERVSNRDREFLEGLAQKWGVPIIRSDGLRALGRDVGREVPRLLRPGKASGTEAE